MITDYKMQNLLQRAKYLSDLGYKINYNSDGYSVYFKDEFIYAAGVKLPRREKLHWKHAQANRRDFLESGVIEAEKHLRKNSFIAE